MTPGDGAGDDATDVSSVTGFTHQEFASFVESMKGMSKKVKAIHKLHVDNDSDSE